VINKKKPIDRYISQLQHDRNTYRIRWSEKDQEYVGRCLKFPRLIFFGQTPEEALEGIRGEVADIVANTPRIILKNQLKEAAEVRRRVAIAKYKRIEAEIRKRIEAERLEAEKQQRIEAERLDIERLSRKEADRQKRIKAKKLKAERQAQIAAEMAAEAEQQKTFPVRVGLLLYRLFRGA
jgi:hypothetical protein